MTYTLERLKVFFLIYFEINGLLSREFIYSLQLSLNDILRAFEASTVMGKWTTAFVFTVPSIDNETCETENQIG